MSGFRVGRDENGLDLEVDLFAPMMSVVSGATRSGKSSFMYGVLALAAEHPHVDVVGVDPSGILLAPFADAYAGTDLEPWYHLGTADPEHAIAVVEGLVAIMDGRLALLRNAGTDQIPLAAFADTFPLVLAVFEEYAGALTWLSGVDQGRKPADRLQSRFLGAVGRLLREGAKTGVRCWIVTQIPRAEILTDRAQLARRVSFRLPSATEVRMLFEAADSDLVERLSNAAPGVGLIHEAGQPHRLFRATAALDYAAYRSRVLAARGTARRNGD